MLLVSTMGPRGQKRTGGKSAEETAAKRARHGSESDDGGAGEGAGAAEDVAVEAARREAAEVEAEAERETQVFILACQNEISAGEALGMAARHAGGPLPRAWVDREYLDWTEQVVDRCRGHLLPLERRYDDVLARSRAQLDSEEPGGE